jgi:heme ABC exporter ATP-binding subunit CcmA
MIALRPPAVGASPKLPVCPVAFPEDCFTVRAEALRSETRSYTRLREPGPGEVPLPLTVTLRSAVCLLGRFPALAGVDLDVAEGEIVLLSGPNGAGKTTILRLLAGLLPLASGDGRVLGHDLRTDRRTLRRDLALLAHDTGCYDDLSVRENVRFWTRAAGGSVATADDAIERVGLTRVAGVAHGRLSAGQRRRCALAVVLARQARLLLLDEPHAGLDAASRDLLDGIIAAVAIDGGSVLLASHELDRARPLAGREVAVVAGQAHGALAPATRSAVAEVAR